MLFLFQNIPNGRVALSLADLKLIKIDGDFGASSRTRGGGVVVRDHDGVFCGGR